MSVIHRPVQYRCDYCGCLSESQMNWAPQLVLFASTKAIGDYCSGNCLSLALATKHDVNLICKEKPSGL